MTMANLDDSGGVWAYLISIDWQEPWLWGLIGFHCLCALLTTVIIAFNQQNLQIAIFLIFLGCVYVSEYINEWAASHYKLFSQQQYFDSRGMFISLLFSTPLLLYCFFLVLNWMYSSIQTMIKLKRAKISSERKAMQAKEK